MKSTNETPLESESETSVYTDPFSKAFNCLTEEIDKDLFTQGKAFSLKYLLTRYKSLFRENIDRSSYRTEKPQSRLKAHYGDKVVIQSQRGRSKSSIIFSSSVTVGEAITAATALKESVADVSVDSILEDSDSESDSGRNINTLYHSEKLLRSLAQSVKDKAPSSQR